MSRQQMLMNSRLNARLIILLTSVVFLSPAFAAASSVTEVYDSAGMMAHLTAQVPNLMRLVTAFAYVMGLWLVIRGLLKLKEFGEQRTMMSSQHHIREPIMYIIVGALLIFFPSSITVGVSTFYGNASPLTYMPATGDAWVTAVNNCFTILQLLGVVSFIRGLVILSHAGEHGGGGQGQFAKGTMHVIAGIFCINMYQFILIIAATLGIQYS
jgi:intracellular multiplication protein IcmC